MPTILFNFYCGDPKVMYRINHNCVIELLLWQQNTKLCLLDSLLNVSIKAWIELLELRKHD